MTVKHLTVEELAERLQIPMATIYVWRSRHIGPRGMRIGKYVRYRLEDVEEWERSMLDEDWMPNT